MFTKKDKSVALSKYLLTFVLVLPGVAECAPDIAVSLSQPVPVFKVAGLSEMVVTVSNVGNQAASTPLTLTMPVPVGISAPLKFARNSDDWVCLNPANSLTCTYSKLLAAGASTTLRLPFTPLATSFATVPGPFVAEVAQVTSETNLANNRSPAITVAAVGALSYATTGASCSSTRLNTFTHPDYGNWTLLDPLCIPKYALPLPNAMASYFKLTPNTTVVPGVESYTLDIKQVQTQILPPGFPATNVFAYGDPARPDTFTFPAHTIWANSTGAAGITDPLGKPVKITFRDTRINSTHLLPVDKSIHGAMEGEPEVRSVTHVHGVKGVNQDSDGYPESWGSPTGEKGDNFIGTIPTVHYNANAFDQPNNQESTLLWYHDHTLGMTRLNVYAGLAGLYVLRDANERGFIAANTLPSGNYEQALVLQDRMFKDDGSLAYPYVNADAPNLAVSTVPEFFGKVMLVNGAAWPYLDVEPRRYRLRLLNGSNARFYTLSFSTSTNTGSVPVLNKSNFQVIGTEGGFLRVPATVNSLTIAPGQRYDVVVDFTNRSGQQIYLRNEALAPFPAGNPDEPMVPSLESQIMKFRVNRPLNTAIANKPVPTILRASVPTLTPTVAQPRKVILAEDVDNNGRILPILGTYTDGILGWNDTLTETPAPNSVETWEIYNVSPDAHPVHLHGGHFLVTNRQPMEYTQGTNLSIASLNFRGPAVLPGAEEKTWRDTVIAYPDQVTRIIVKNDGPGLFVWHCHILEHEDHDMMRPMKVQ